MSADDTFRCPGCMAELQIPAQLYVEREIKERGGPFIIISDGSADRRSPLPCPRCACAIPVEYMLRRPPKGSWLADSIGCAVVMGGLFALILFFSGGC